MATDNNEKPYVYLDFEELAKLFMKITEKNSSSNGSGDTSDGDELCRDRGEEFHVSTSPEDDLFDYEDGENPWNGVDRCEEQDDFMYEDEDDMLDPFLNGYGDDEYDDR